MAHCTLTLCYKEIEFDVDVEGDVVRGGSNSYGSDEPEWIDIEGVAYTHPQRGTPLSPRLVKWIEKNHDDYVSERLIESDSEW